MSSAIVTGRIIHLGERDCSIPAAQPKDRRGMPFKPMEFMEILHVSFETRNRNVFERGIPRRSFGCAAGSTIAFSEMKMRP